jgi:hypothetical protein
MMVTGVVVIVVVVVLVLVSRYRETHDFRWPNPLKWFRILRLREQKIGTFKEDESAKRFAEQWASHPTLTQRQADAIKRSLRKKNRG